MDLQIVKIDTSLFFIWEMLHDNESSLTEFELWEDKEHGSKCQIKFLLDYSERHYLSLVYKDDNEMQTIFKIARVRFKTYDDFLKRIGKILTFPYTLQKIEKANLKWFNNPKHLYLVTRLNTIKNGVVIEKVQKSTIIITEDQLRFIHCALKIKPWCSGTLGIDFLKDYINAAVYKTNVEIMFDNIWEYGATLRYYASDENYEMICDFPYFQDFESFAFTATAVLKQPEVRKRLKEVNEEWFNYKQEVDIKTYQSV